MSLQISRAMPAPRQATRLCLRLVHPSRALSASTQRRVDDPVANVAAAVTGNTAPAPDPASIPSRTPSERSDDTNPALFPSADQLPPTNNKAHEEYPDRALHATQPKPSRVPQRQQQQQRPQSQRKNQNQSQSDMLTNLLSQNIVAVRERERKLKAQAEARSELSTLKQTEKQQRRVWREGDVYAPHDLSAAEQIKAYRARTRGNAPSDSSAINTRKRGWRDIIDELGIDPLKEYKNPAMMGEFVSVLGRIRHRKETGLRGVNQRKVAKAIRRAVGIGMMPSTHRHPEMHPMRYPRGGQLRSSAIKFDAR